MLLIALCFLVTRIVLNDGNDLNGLNNPTLWMILKQQDKMDVRLEAVLKLSQENKERLQEIKSDPTSQDIAKMSQKLKTLETILNDLKTADSYRNRDIAMMQTEIESLKNFTSQDITEMTKKLKALETTLNDKKAIDSIRNGDIVVMQAEIQRLKSFHNHECQSGWKRFGNHCYLFVYDKTSWQTATNNCRNKGSQLVKIENAEENTWLKSMVEQAKGNTENTGIWIGLSDLAVEGQWRWESDNSLITFNDWHPNEPSNTKGKQNCGQFWCHLSVYKWDDYFCDELTDGYICKN